MGRWTVKDFSKNGLSKHMKHMWERKEIVRLFEDNEVNYELFVLSKGLNTSVFDVALCLYSFHFITDFNHCFK